MGTEIRGGKSVLLWRNRVKRGVSMPNGNGAMTEKEVRNQYLLGRYPLLQEQKWWIDTYYHQKDKEYPVG
jgi:hypothetical protein